MISEQNLPMGLYQIKISGKGKDRKFMICVTRTSFWGLLRTEIWRELLCDRTLFDLHPEAIRQRLKDGTAVVTERVYENQYFDFVLRPLVDIEETTFTIE